MSKTPKTVFICQNCGHGQAKWSGRCPQCQEWNSLVETVVSTSKSKIKNQKSKPQLKAQNLSEVATNAASRISTGIGEFDRVLGGGLVPGSVILLAGEPGVGKSTLLLQVGAKFSIFNFQFSKNSPNNPTVLYVSGEESPQQLKLRADRLGLATENIQVLAETDVDAISSQLLALSARHGTNELGAKEPSAKGLVIIDSVQTLTTADLSAPAGSISQVRECSYRLAREAKTKNVSLLLVGHVTKEGAVAGPKVLEHLVDAVIHLSGDKFHTFRLLRAEKNRFGSAQEVGVFEMTDRGLKEVTNPSDAFLAERLGTVPGSVVTATMEGTRPVLVEIQALTTPTSLTYPRRTASGFDLNRLNLLIAVLQKHLKVPLQNKDIYVNVAGGFKISEPAADLACALAIVSSVKDRPIDPKICVFGEVGLSGEVRKVPQTDRRIKEAKKLGFTEVISPENVRSVQEAVKKLKVKS